MSVSAATYRDGRGGPVSGLLSCRDSVGLNGRNRVERLIELNDLSLAVAVSVDHGAG